MKVKVIRTYDMSSFSNELEELYQTKVVQKVDTSTEVLTLKGQEVIYYIAIVFYRDRTSKIETICNSNVEDCLDSVLENTDIPTRVRYAIRRYNDNVKACKEKDGKKYNIDFYNKEVNTVDDLVEFINDGKLAQLRNIGPSTINSLKAYLVEAGYAREV